MSGSKRETGAGTKVIDLGHGFGASLSDEPATPMRRKSSAPKKSNECSGAGLSAMGMSENKCPRCGREFHAFNMIANHNDIRFPRHLPQKGQL